MKYLVVLAVLMAVCTGLWMGAQRDGAPDALSKTAEVLATAVDSASVTAPETAEVLTANGFDHDRAVADINGSDLSALNKTSTKAALDRARNEPEQLRVVLDGLRDRLGVAAP